MAKCTTLKDALKRWEERTKQQAPQAREIDLQFQWPPVEKMDNTLAALVHCERLSLSTNMIDKIGGLSAAMRNLRVLSLGRNYIKTVAGLEAVADTLQELWLSYNLIEKLKGIQVLRRLRILCLSNNLVKEWVEFNRLQELAGLESLVFVGNPLVEAMGGGDTEVTWRSEATRRLPGLKKLDGETIVVDEVVAGAGDEEAAGGGAAVAAVATAVAGTE